jgi:acyl dehydratase
MTGRVVSWEDEEGRDIVKRRKFTASAYFEDLQIGETFYIPSRTQTEALFAAFQLASGDNHPLHYDVEYCKARGYPGFLAHGFQTLIQTAPGASDLPHRLGDTLIAFIEQSSRFLKPVFAGDTLYPELTIIGLTPRHTTGVVTIRSAVYNQKDELCLEGEMKLLVKKRQPDSR